ncbi:hypothetical protein GCM10017744_081180 [Streptomyces antimycoticus]|uniref:PEP phosphonomutase n=1 Tax=Streptomyces antimycoticus TaxID=68175 RepID=A0A4D4JWR7_9ACTN|nr:hypothetical protein SANT12839_020170 [Streptomyces antimycoticus]
MCRAFAPPSGDERFPWSAWEPTLASGLTVRMRRGTYYQRPVDGPSFGEVDADVGFPPERTTQQCSAGRMTATQQAKPHLFRSLHTVAGPFALANAWDVASARVIESAGAPAIATTSAGVAWSLGCPDGDALARDEALKTISRITAAVAVPVTADVEGGYGQDAADVAETITGVLAAGAVGVNIEDGTRPPGELATRPAVARRTADRAGADLFLNARIDTYLLGLGNPDTRLGETLSRAHRYVDAGADGIFVPGVTDTAPIAAPAKDISVPAERHGRPPRPDRRRGGRPRRGPRQPGLGRGAGRVRCRSPRGAGALRHRWLRLPRRGDPLPGTQRAALRAPVCRLMRWVAPARSPQAASGAARKPATPRRRSRATARRPRRWA